MWTGAHPLINRESLALKSDRAGDWDKKKEQAAFKDLAPRAVDAGRKSTWAHGESPLQEISPAALVDPAKATCEIQALALFIFEQRSPATPRRNKILGVSIHRDAIRADLILEDACEHPIEAYATTHRSLLLDREEDRKEVAANLLAGSSYRTWRYTREMLAELLESLLAGDHIAPSFQADAKSLLVEWRS